MIKDHYDLIRTNKTSFWWFRGRKDLFHKMLVRRLEAPLELGLDAGCGPMTNENLFADFAKWWLALDHSRESFKDGGTGSNIQRTIGDLGALPIRGDKMDIVFLLDVLEHVKDEMGVLTELKRVLRSGGMLLISVPAFDCLWSLHDEQAGHQRRYSGGELKSLCRQLGFEIIDDKYFNSFLFLPIYAARKILRILPKGKERLEMNLSPRFLDLPLYLMLKLENLINLSLFRLPFGTSYILLLRKAHE